MDLISRFLGAGKAWVGYRGGRSKTRGLDSRGKQLRFGDGMNVYDFGDSDEDAH